MASRDYNVSVTYRIDGETFTKIVPAHGSTTAKAVRAARQGLRIDFPSAAIVKSEIVYFNGPEMPADYAEQYEAEANLNGASWQETTEAADTNDLSAATRMEQEFAEWLCAWSRSRLDEAENAEALGASHAAEEPEIPPYLLGSLGCERDVCVNLECPEAIKERPDTGRFYITMGHPGFNTAANNGVGYANHAAALGALHRYCSAEKVVDAIVEKPALAAKIAGTAARNDQFAELLTQIEANYGAVFMSVLQAAVAELATNATKVSGWKADNTLTVKIQLFRSKK